MVQEEKKLEQYMLVSLALSKTKSHGFLHLDKTPKASSNDVRVRFDILAATWRKPSLVSRELPTSIQNTPQNLQLSLSVSFSMQSENWMVTCFAPGLRLSSRVHSSLPQPPLLLRISHIVFALPSEKRRRVFARGGVYHFFDQ